MTSDEKDKIAICDADFESISVAENKGKQTRMSLIQINIKVELDAVLVINQYVLMTNLASL